MRQLSTKHPKPHSPSSDIMRQISTKTPKPHSHPRPTQCDRYRQKKPKPHSPSTDKMRQISTKKPKPHSPSTDTMRQISTQTQSRSSPSSDKMRQISTKTPKPPYPPLGNADVSERGSTPPHSLRTGGLPVQQFTHAIKCSASPNKRTHGNSEIASSASRTRRSPRPLPPERSKDAACTNPSRSGRFSPPIFSQYISIACIVVCFTTI